MSNPTLRDLTGMNPDPAPISESALVLIDCQQTYREGVMQLEGVEPALEELSPMFPNLIVFYDQLEKKIFDVKEEQK